MFKRLYNEGTFPPERTSMGHWNVWCAQGLLDVLSWKEYESLDQGEVYINVANTAMIRALPGDPVWQELSRIAEDFDVSVFPASLTADAYAKWNSDAGCAVEFDAVRIRRRPARA